MSEQPKLEAALRRLGEREEATEQAGGAGRQDEVEPSAASVPAGRKREANGGGTSGVGQGATSKAQQAALLTRLMDVVQASGFGGCRCQFCLRSTIGRGLAEAGLMLAEGFPGSDYAGQAGASRAP